MTIRQFPPTVAEDPIETRLRAALQAQATTDVPDTRFPPPIEWPETTARRAPRPPWLMPLAAAASVVAITAGIVATQTWGRSGAQAPAATTGVTTGVSTGASSSAPTSAPATSAPATTVASSGTAKASVSGMQTVQAPGLPGVTLAIPPNWTTSPFSREASSPVIGAKLCVGGANGCPIEVIKLDPAEARINIEFEGGILSDPAYCDAADGPFTRVLKDARVDTFGGRPADYRYWVWTCGNGAVHEIAQYAVAAPAGYVLFSESANADMRAVMSDIAAESTLPAARAGGVRLCDQGAVKSVTPTSGGLTIELQRSVGSHNSQWTWPSTSTYRYFIPTAAIPKTTHPFTVQVDDWVMLYSNGAEIVEVFYPEISNPEN